MLQFMWKQSRSLVLIVAALLLLSSTGLSAAQAANACFVTPSGSQGVNMRGGPGTNYPRAQVLAVGDTVEVTGQRNDENNMRWWRTFSGGWVRSDVVTTSGDCESAPQVEPPPDYCFTRTELSERPEVGEGEQRLGTERFVVHYTTQGVNAATEDYAQAVADTLEESFDVQVNQLGWPLPPPDCGEGGDERFDVYLLDLSQDGTLGYASPEHVIGDNPFSDEVEVYASYSHLVVENDVADSDLPLNVMRATVAHEVHHNIQFSYDFAEPLFAVYEWGAAWMETQVYPELEDAVGYNYMLTRYPDVCMANRPEDPADPLRDRIYAEWLIQDSLVKDFGADAMHSVLWRAFADYEGVEGLNKAFEQLGTDQAQVRLRAAVRNALVDHTLPLRFFEPVYIEALVDTNNLEANAGIFTPRRDGVQQMAVDYVYVPYADVAYRYSISEPNLHLYFLGVDRYENKAFLYDIGQEGAVSAQFSDGYLIILNTTPIEDGIVCDYTDWELRIEPLDPSESLGFNEEFDLVDYRSALQYYQGVDLVFGNLRNFKDIFSHYMLVYPDETINLTARPTDPNSGLDLLIYIKDVDADPSEDPIASNDDSDGLNPELSWTNDTGAQVFLQVAVTAAVQQSAGDFVLVAGMNEEADESLYPYSEVP